MNRILAVLLTVIGLWFALVMVLAFTGNEILAVALLLLLITWVGYLWFTKSIGIVQQFEQVYVLRLGRTAGVRDAGVFIAFWPLEEARRVNTQLETSDLDSIRILTSDAVSVTILPSYASRVTNAEDAAINVRNYRQSTNDMVQGALQLVVGASTVTEVLEDREALDSKIQDKVNEQTGPFGVNVTSIWWRDLDVPQSTLDALSVTAGAKRSADARLIEADAELKVARTLAEAARILHDQPGGMQVRTLQMIERGMDRREHTVVLYPYSLEDRTDPASLANLAKNGKTTEYHSEVHTIEHVETPALEDSGATPEPTTEGGDNQE